MPADRDVEAFDRRALGYERGWLGKLHRDIADRTAQLAVASAPAAERALDVGCGTGYLLRRLSSLLPRAVELQGVDPAPSMVEVATSLAPEGRPLRFQAGVAEKLPFPDRAFDLVVSTTSFDHWEDQGRGLSECARVLCRGGHLVLADQFSAWLLPTLLVSRRGQARTVGRVGKLLAEAGFSSPEWHGLGLVLVKAVTATI